MSNIMDGSVRRAVARAANELHEAQTVDDAIEDIIRGALQALPTFGHIGVAIVEDDAQVMTRAASTPLTYDFDAIQYSAHEGPCLDSLDLEQVVAAPRVWADNRWPNYAAKIKDGTAARIGDRSGQAA